MFRIKLKELRESCGLSQYTFANKFGVAQSTVGSWEAGKREPNFDTMQKLADFFDVTVDFLLGRSDIKKEPTVKDDGLPSLEKEFIEKFSKLTPGQKELMLAQIDGILNRRVNE